MKALVFAAGRGERMRPLTDASPKPLLEVGGKPLIVWHLERFAAAGIRDVVINVSHLAARFPAVLGDGSRWSLSIRFSHEGDQPLETGGGMLHALPLLGDARADEPFVVVNGDVWTDIDFARLPREPRGLAHLVMVDRPVEKPRGDFTLDAAGLLHDDRGDAALTYSGIGIYRRGLLDGWRRHVPDDAGTRARPPRFPLAPLLRAAMADRQITGEHHRGAWHDVGTPERLAALDACLRARAG